MAYYNLTNITNSTNLWEMTEQVNLLSDGWLGLGIMITFSAIIFISLKDYPFKDAAAATTFISTVMAMLFRILGMISDFTLMIYVILTGVAIIALVFNKG